jgi:regulatory protein
MSNTPDAKEKRPRKITESYLHNAGLHYLGRYVTSAHNFRRVMKRKIDRSCKFHPEPPQEECLKMLEALIIKFTELGLLDDSSYARGLVISYRRRGLSGNAIMAKLKMKGVDRETGQKALSHHTENGPQDLDADTVSGLKFLKRKKAGPFAVAPASDPDKARSRALGALARAGYGYDISSRLYEMDHEEAQETLSRAD